MKWLSLLLMLGMGAAFVGKAKHGSLRMGALKSAPEPISLIVSVTIKEDRLTDFLKVIEEDAVGSRERENGGCYRFDVIQVAGTTNKFVFYEVYRDDEAVKFHKAAPHFALWRQFKESGGVLEQEVVKGKGIFYGSKIP
jgi:autoinducer 2-degrading protein